MTPSASDLHYFIKVANLSNLSRAAADLNISQPSLTLAMQRLEMSVGTPLLIRHKRGVTLTQAGKQLQVHARQMIEHWEAIKSATTASVTEVRGTITIGCHHSIGVYSLPLFLADVLEKYPQLEIKLHHDISRKIIDKVLNLEIDIGICVNPIKHLDLVIKKIADDEFKLWRPKSANRSIQQLTSGNAVIICDPDLSQTQSLLKKIKSAAFNYSRLLSVNSLEVTAELTKSGCGIGMLPANVAIPRNLIPVPKSPIYEDEICVLYRGENRNLKAIRAITDAIQQGFKKLPNVKGKR